jgi:hypothetical protein
VYPLLEVTEDKHIARPGIRPGRAHELVGVDGQIQGGIRPIKGFKKVYELDFYGGNFTYAPNNLHDEQSEITDFFPINFRIGDDGYGYGFVYRSKRTDGSGLADVFVDFWNSCCDGVNFGTTGEPLVQACSQTQQMDVAVFGRIVYVTIEGRSPALFYLREPDTPTSSSSLPSTSSRCDVRFEIKKIGETAIPPFPGPGKQPNLRSPEEAGALGTLYSTEGAERPASGQVVLTRDGPKDSGLFGDLSSSAVPFEGFGNVGPIINQVVSNGLLIQKDINVTTGDIIVCVVPSLFRGAGNYNTLQEVHWRQEASGGSTEYTFDEEMTFVQRVWMPMTDEESSSESSLFAHEYQQLDLFVLTNPTVGYGELAVINQNDGDGGFEGFTSYIIEGANTADPFHLVETNKIWDDDDGTLSFTVGGSQQGALALVSAIRFGTGSYLGTKSTNPDPGDPDVGTPFGAMEFFANHAEYAAMGRIWNNVASTTDTVDYSHETADKRNHLLLGVVVQGEGLSTPSSTTGFATSTSSEPTELQDFLDLFSVTLLDPDNNDVNVSREAVLVWRGRYSDGRALNDSLVYDVYFSAVGQGTPTRVARDLPAYRNSFNPGSLYRSGLLPFGTAFRWFIRARLSDFPQYPNDFVSSDQYEFTTEEEFDAREMEPGDYTFAFMLMDSETGRRSAISKIAQVTKEEFDLGQVSNTSQSAGALVNHFIAMEIVYDSAKFNQAFIYRSVKIQDAGGTFVAERLQLDAIVDLEDYHTRYVATGEIFDPAVTNIRQSVYYYTLEDKQLAFQDRFRDRSIFDERMPYGGTALVYEGTMLLSSISDTPISTDDAVRPADAIVGLGELRWSSLVDISPELFPPFNRYTPNTPSDQVIRLMKVGGNVIGFSKDRMYHIRRHSAFIQVQEMHEGFGVVNHRAVDSAGSMLYFVSPSGLKAVDYRAALDDVSVFDSQVIEEWDGQHDSISCAYDPLLNLLFVLNDDADEASCIWFNSGRATEIHDLPFKECRQGWWPSSYDTSSDYDNTLQKRALFLQNSPDLDTTITGWKPRIFLLDHTGRRTISGSNIAGFDGETRLTTLDVTGDTRFELALAFAGSGPNKITVLNGASDPDLGTGMEGAVVYVVDAADTSIIGTKATIMRKNNATTFEVISPPASWSSLLKAGDRVAISPVYFRWIGHNVMIQTDTGEQFGSAGDFLRIKHINGLGCAFTDVGGPPFDDSDTDDRFAALVFKGVDTTEHTRSYPVDENGEDVSSIADEEGQWHAAFGKAGSEGKFGVKGNSLSPAVEIVCPDLDFRLLAVAAKGKILATERGTHGRTT